MSAARARHTHGMSGFFFCVHPPSHTQPAKSGRNQYESPNIMTDERKVFFSLQIPKSHYCACSWLLLRLFVVVVYYGGSRCRRGRIGLATQHTTRRVGRGLSRGTNQRRRRSRAVVMWAVVEEEEVVMVVYK